MGNIALNKMATASSFVLPFSPGRAVDGSTSPLSRWVCSSVPGWLMVDMGSTIPVNRWVVKHMGGSGFWPAEGYNNRDYKFQGSNDQASWTDIDTVTGNTQNITDRTTGIVNFRYYRVAVTSGLNANGKLASIEEFEVYEAPVPFLTSLTLSSGTLNPAFDRAVYSYTASVVNDTASIIVTAVTGGVASTMKINGLPATSGQPSGPVSLAVGANKITVQLASQGVPEQVYNVTVTRASSPYLTKVEIHYYGRGIDGTVTVNMDHTTTSYTAGIPAGATQVTITPYVEDTAAQIVVNNQQLNNGQASAVINVTSAANQIPMQVKPSDGQPQRSYTLTITK